MADSAELHVALRPAMAEAVQRAVDSGEYASQDEVVGEALLEWRLRRELNASERETLLRLWDEGVASGLGRFKDIDEVKQEARRRWASEANRRQAES